MEPLYVIAVLITLAALLAWLNDRFLGLPMNIGLVLMSLGVSLVLLALEAWGLPVRAGAGAFVRGIDFGKVLLEGMLGLLLFAGALHVDLNDLAEQKWAITIFATFGVLASTFLVGSAVFALSHLMGLGLRYIDGLLFGALISPTDPIAVIGILKKAGVPKSLETKIAGESLFNDGIGVVIFLLLFETATGSGQPDAGHIAALLAKEALGGALFGLAAGYAAYLMLRRVNNYRVETLVTLALVMGGYTLANALHLSAPLAMVLAGLLIGNHGRRLAMSDTTREHLDDFWELVDEILNAVLFVLIGLEVMVLTLDTRYILAGLLAVPIALLARLLSLGLPVGLMRKYRPFSPGAVRVMTWGGLRGGISVALALSLCQSCGREVLLTMTYVVVVFSIVVQGLTIKGLAAGAARRSAV
ncbi:MAG: sodium:proton antiporter [Proteobacteria bacterium]|nr:sodium:proton antiporter [Pseudomonadota bacterium]